MMTKASARYVTLDGMRGLAAICVALIHLDFGLMPGGYLAVDFFFVLSGFVLRKTYLPRVRDGLGAGRFMLQRIIRLYPLYFVGFVIGLLFALQGAWRGSDHSMTFAVVGTSATFNLFMLPTPFSLFLFPINGVSWSLFFELVANLAMVLFLIRLRRSLLLLTALAGVALVASEIWLRQTAAGVSLLASGLGVGSGGASWPEFSVGLTRTAFSFMAGMVIATDREADTIRWRSRLASGASLLIGLALIAVMLVPVPVEKRLPFDLFAVLLVSPLLVWMGTKIEPSRTLAIPAAFVGEVSFALYAVHSPLTHAFQFFARKLHVSNLVIAPAFLLAALLLAWLSVRLIDLPARKALTNAFLKRKTAPGL
jgi:peptidoglycan/LPS O-acetylase OafA/YrhL